MCNGMLIDCLAMVAAFLSTLVLREKKTKRILIEAMVYMDWYILVAFDRSALPLQDE